MLCQRLINIDKNMVESTKLPPSHFNYANQPTQYARTNFYTALSLSHKAVALLSFPAMVSKSSSSTNARLKQGFTFLTGLEIIQ